MADAETVAEVNTPRFIGTIRWFNATKGYGFIMRPDERDTFVHATDAKASGLGDELDEGDLVSFELKDTPRGIKAINLRRETDVSA